MNRYPGILSPRNKQSERWNHSIHNDRLETPTLYLWTPNNPMENEAPQNMGETVDGRNPRDFNYQSQLVSLPDFWTINRMTPKNMKEPRGFQTPW